MYTKHRASLHLTQEDRFVIETLLQEHYSYRNIEESTGIPFFTVGREIERNKDSRGRYSAKVAEEKSKERRLNSKRSSQKIETNYPIAKIIEEHLSGTDSLHGDWSPEVIANTVLKGKICHQTIYSWIKRSRKDLLHHLPHQGRRRIKYGQKKARLVAYRALMPSIEERPEEVLSREKIGHYEGDTIVLKEGRIHTLAERKSRFLLGELITVKGTGLAWHISESAIKIFSKIPKTHRKTLTYDRGSEFSWWNEVEKNVTKFKIYFAHPYHSWERGTNERSNGLIRRYFPKGEKFATIKDEDVQKVLSMINHRPRKILRWKTPCEVFGRCCSSG